MVVGHYLPPFTVNGPSSTQRALCGRFVDPASHRSWPDCPDCQKQLRTKIPSFDCVVCREDKTGRFGRDKFASGNGWQRGFTSVSWYCWDCKPFGEMRHEQEEVSHVRA